MNRAILREEKQSFKSRHEQLQFYVACHIILHND